MKKPSDPPARLLESSAFETAADAATAAALSRLADVGGEPAVDRVSQERVWRMVAQHLPPRRRHPAWLAIPSGAALAVAVVVLALARKPAPAPAPFAQVSASARVVLTAGRVLATAPREAWTSAAAGGSLAEASRVRTEGGRAAFALGRAQVLLSANSDLALESLGGNTFLRLGAGEVLCQVAPRKVGESFVIQTTRYRVTVKGTVFAVRQRAEDDVEVSVSRGLVEVSGQGGRWLVPAGKSWHSRSPETQAADDILPEQRSLLEQAAAPGPRARIEVLGAAQEEISEGGVQLGPSPITWDAPVGAYHFIGSGSEGDVTTVSNVPAVLNLSPKTVAVPHEKSAGRGAEATRAVVVPVPPATSPEVLPQRAPAKTRPSLSSPPGESSGGREDPPNVDAVSAPAQRVEEGAAPISAEYARLEPQALKPTTPTFTLSPPPTPAPLNAPPVVLAPDPYAAALALARAGSPLAAAAAFGKVVATKGAHADLALYELGHLRQQRLGDPLGALDAYRAYQDQYPRGPLAQEVSLSVIEIELQQENLTGALTEIDRFLDAHGKSERASEVHLLRGDVLRQRGDDRAAAAEYERAQESGTGDVAEEGLYRGAACRERIGDSEAAGDALRAYLTRFPKGRHAAEAKHALGVSTPP